MQNKNWQKVVAYIGYRSTTRSGKCGVFSRYGCADSQHSGLRHHKNLFWLPLSLVYAEVTGLTENGSERKYHVVPLWLATEKGMPYERDSSGNVVAFNAKSNQWTNVNFFKR